MVSDPVLLSDPLDRLVPSAIAQETTATVTGTVTDPSGGVLPGVIVSLKHVATGRHFESITHRGGRLLGAPSADWYL